MCNDLDRLIRDIEQLDTGSKQWIFEAIRKDVTVHRLEHEFGIPAYVILEAISRSSDLTRRGVRGVIAETIFATEVAPLIRGWRDDTPSGDHPYDVRLSNDGRHARIQVKMQRRQRGEPLMRAKAKGGVKDQYVVEVQRTRTGEKSGVRTRPYRYAEFDLLAVCMQPSTHDWRNFLYAPVLALAPRGDKSGSPLPAPNPDMVIETLQCVPAYPAEGDPVWTSDLALALERYAAA